MLKESPGVDWGSKFTFDITYSTEVSMLRVQTAFTSRSFYWNNLFFIEHSPSTPVKGLFVLLHGFPAWVSKNYDVGELLALHGYKVLIPHHQGLGQSNGTFDFLKTIENTSLIIKTIKELHPDLPFSICGHSWGGYLSLHHLKEITDKLILLAPLAHFPKDLRREHLIKGLYDKNRADIPTYDLETLKSVFNELEQRLDYRALQSKDFSADSLLIYGTNDEVIPADLIADFAREIKSLRHTTIVTDDDHRLSKRRPVLEQIKSWLNSR
jgi:alpha-beta hydrolase superfamily lysophospholipase